ncbi:hypothetical protein LMG3410_02086 [Achromobacter aegrifaciens]|nr:hypothetical protein LMG3410_02086 [Achromobacter aegrifaciens]
MIQRGTSGVPVRARVPSTVRKGGARARAAEQLCRNTRFQDWVVARVGAAPQGVTAKQHATQFVRDVCGVTSRAELDHNAKAASLFYLAIRKPFIKWSGIYG